MVRLCLHPYVPTRAELDEIVAAEQRRGDMDEYSGGLLSEHRFPETDKRPVIHPDVNASDNGRRIRNLRKEVVGDVLLTIAEFDDGDLKTVSRSPRPIWAERNNPAHYQETAPPMVDSDESETGRKVSERWVMTLEEIEKERREVKADDKRDSNREGWIDRDS